MSGLLLHTFSLQQFLFSNIVQAVRVSLVKVDNKGWISVSLTARRSKLNIWKTGNNQENYIRHNECSKWLTWTPDDAADTQMETEESTAYIHERGGSGDRKQGHQVGGEMHMQYIKTLKALKAQQSNYIIIKSGSNQIIVLIRSNAFAMLSCFGPFIVYYYFI